MSCLIRDTSAGLFGDLSNPLVGTINGTTVAGSGSAAIEQMLDGGSDVDTLGASGDLYTISQGGHGTVGPAGTAVLRNVLVSGDSAVVHTVLVAPGKVSWVGLNSQKVVVGA